MKTMEHALELAAKGWHVHPVGADKRPILKGWPTQATTNLAQVEAWWQEYPDALVAVVPALSGHTVVDIDVHDDRPSGFEAALFEGAPIEAQVQGTSLSGNGRHLWYRGVGRTVTNVNGIESVDVRGVGGYVVVPYTLPGASQVTEPLPTIYQARDVVSPSRRASASEVQDWLQKHDGPLDDRLKDYAESGPHPFRGRNELFKRLRFVVLAGEEGASGAAKAVEIMRRRWEAAPHNEGPREAEREFQNALAAHVADAADHDWPISIEIVNEGEESAEIGALMRETGQTAEGEEGDEPVEEQESEPLFIDLETLDDMEQVQATIGVRDDGACLIYPEAVNVLVGDPEQGKSLVAAALAVEVVQRGGVVVWLDLDHNGAPAFRSRLVALGAGEFLSQIKFAQPDDREGVAEVVGWVAENKPDLFVVDSMGELLPMFGANSDSADDYTRVHRLVLTTAARSGAAVLAIDHLAKGADSRAYGASGTMAKKRAVDGAMFRVEALRPFVPGKGGEASMKLIKDRHGSVRAAGDGNKEPVIARFVLAGGGDDGGGDWSLESPAPRVDPVDQDVIALALLDPSPTSQREVRARMKWGAERTKKAWERWNS